MSSTKRRTKSKMPKTIKYGIYLALAAGMAIQIFHAGEQEVVPTPVFYHWLRDSLLAGPIGIIAAASMIEPARRLAPRLGIKSGGFGEKALYCFLVACIYALGMIPGNLVHGGLFVRGGHSHLSGWSHGVNDAIRVLDPAFMVMLLAVWIYGAPWEATPARAIRSALSRVRSRVSGRKSRVLTP